MEQREVVTTDSAEECRAHSAYIRRCLKNGTEMPRSDMPWRSKLENGEVTLMTYDRRELAVYRVCKRQLHFVR